MDIQRTVARFMHDGDHDRGGVQYRWPIITCNFKPSDIGSEWWMYIAELNNKGCFNISYAEQVSSCCRLLSNYKLMQKLKVYSNGISGIKIGSLECVALNLPGLMQECYGDIPSFMNNLDVLMEDVARYLVAHRAMLGELFKDGFNQFFSEFTDPIGRKLGIGPLFDIRMFFSTFGVIGESDLLKKIGLRITEEEGIRIVEGILWFIEDKKNKLSKKYGVPFNVEQIPGETAAFTMAAFYGDEGYCTQFVPSEEPISIWDRVKIEGRFASILSGGSMTFLNLGSLMTPEQSVLFHKRVMEVSGGKLNQSCVNYGWTICKSPAHEESVSFVGVHDHCPECGAIAPDVHTEERVVGYMVPHVDMNTKRRKEAISRYRE
jgi:ribonucleoside-triphosphate reductase